MTSITDSISFPENLKGYISIFPNNEGANVTLKGLKYTVEDVEISPSTTLGTSNEFVGERGEISVKNGNLLVVWYESQDSFRKNLNKYIKKNFD